MLSRQLSPQENMVQEKYQFLGLVVPDPVDPNFDPVAWANTCQEVFNKNIALIGKSYDTFILKCSSDFDPLISGLQVSDSTLTWARWMAEGWGYESPATRVVREGL